MLIYFSGLPVVEAISILLSAAFVIGTGYFIAKTGWLRVRIDRVSDVVLKSDATKRRVERSWDSIERHFFSGDDNQLKLAIMKADTLLEEALREAGVPGKDLGERLKRMKASDLPNLQNVWDAHKLRNRIAHETDFTLKRDLAERALTVYEQALTHLGALAEIPPIEPEKK